MTKEKAKIVHPEDMLLTVTVLHPEFLLLNEVCHKELTSYDHLQSKIFHLSDDDSDLELILNDNTTQNIKFIRKRVFVESYNQKHLIFALNDDKEKVIILEFTADHHVAKYVKRLVARRNDMLFYQSTLVFNPSCADRRSFFSSENTNVDLRGFIHLAILLMFSNNFMLILDNFLKYGFVIKENFMAFDLNVTHHGFYICLAGITALFCLSYLLVIKSYFEGMKKGKRVAIQAAIVISILLFPVISNSAFGISFFSMIFLNCITMCCALKTISFFFVANELIDSLALIIKEAITEDQYDMYFKDNILPRTTFQSLVEHRNITHLLPFKLYAQFLFMPTLCFQTSYPRTNRIRKRFLLKMSFLYMLTQMMLLFIFGQYIMPIINSSYEDFQGEAIIPKIKLILRLALPNSVAWIMTFFSGFEFFLNVMAELTYFADREFYKEWWNCRDLGEYWRLWNIPVHNWFVRHIYNPMIYRGFSKDLGGLTIFFISAIGHEYVISVALGRPSYWAFLAMLMQFFIIIFERQLSKVVRYQQTVVGNLSFWLSFCIIGQPVLMLCYYIDHTSQQNSHPLSHLKELLAKAYSSGFGLRPLQLQP